MSASSPDQGPQNSSLLEKWATGAPLALIGSGAIDLYLDLVEHRSLIPGGPLIDAAMMVGGGLAMLLRAGHDESQP